jgi:hypothetical protein
VVVVGLETTGCAGVTPSAQLLVQTVKTIQVGGRSTASRSPGSLQLTGHGGAARGSARRAAGSGRGEGDDDQR